MREILFRGKEQDCRSFHYVDWCYGSLVYSPSENHYYIVEHCEQELCFPVSEETVGQYTGKTDRNGIKIFEGDLLYFRNSNHDEEDGAMKVIFEDGAFAISGDIFVDLNETYDWELEVIGNIHDNPELLEFQNE